jgi:hypothetical protein
MFLIKLCAYVNVLLTTINNDKLFCFYVDTVEPLIIGDMSYSKWLVYDAIAVSHA